MKNQIWTSHQGEMGQTQFTMMQRGVFVIVASYLQFTLHKDSLLLLVIQDVKNDHGNASSNLYQCTLGTKCITPDAVIVSGLHFETGVVNIQNVEAMTMTVAEAVACSQLLKPMTNAGVTGQQQGNDTHCLTNREWNRGESRE
jgi:hypothetical protein